MKKIIGYYLEKFQTSYSECKNLCDKIIICLAFGSLLLIPWILFVTFIWLFAVYSGVMIPTIIIFSLPTIYVIYKEKQKKKFEVTINEPKEGGSQ